MTTIWSTFVAVSSPAPVTVLASRPTPPQPNLHTNPRYSRMLMITLAFEVDRLEIEIRKQYPEMRYIDIEIL